MCLTNIKKIRFEAINVTQMCVVAENVPTFTKFDEFNMPLQ